MKFERDDVKVGLLVVAALGLLGSLALQRTLAGLFQKETSYQVELQGVPDLVVGTDVVLQGLKVGQTKDIALRKKGTNYDFVATIGIRPDVVLWRGTNGVVVSRVVGGAFLELRLPPPADRRVELTAGERIPGETASSINTLVASLDLLANNLDRAVNEMRDELRSRGLDSLVGRPEIRQAVGDASLALGAFRKASVVLEKTAIRGEVTLQQIDVSMESLAKSLVIVQGILERRGTNIDELIVELGETLKVLRGAGENLDRLLLNAGPDAVQGLRALHRTLTSMEELLELLKAKPNRVVFGTPSDKERDEARRRAEEARRTEDVPIPR